MKDILPPHLVVEPDSYEVLMKRRETPEQAAWAIEKERTILLESHRVDRENRLWIRIGVALILGISLVLIFSGDKELLKFGMGLLSTAIASILSYMTGRAQGKASE